MKLLSPSEIFVMALLGTMSSCGFYREKNQDGDFSYSQGELSYSLVNSRIISRQCVACHNSVSAKAGVVLDSYDSVKQNLNRIEQAALITQNMPPTGPLETSSQKLLRAWIAAGAPKEGTGTPEPTLEPTFTSIKRNVFEGKCVSCHTTGGEAEKVPLLNYAELLNSPRELVLPGNATESALILAVEATDDRQMPPKTSGLGHLSDREITIIKRWIQDGAQEN